jgi:hypothetical protein
MRSSHISRRSWWRRLVVLALTSLLALTAATAQAQGVWLTLPSMPTARYSLARATAPCPEGPRLLCVYAIGGHNNSGNLDVVEAYRPTANTWTTLPGLTTTRSGLSAAAAPCPDGLRGACVYAIGGFNGPGVVNSVEAYSPAANTWTTLPALPTARAQLAVTAAPCPKDVGRLRGTCVYAIGGQDAANTLNTVEAYSPATNTWATLRALPGPRLLLAATAASCPAARGLRGTCVYAIGGRNGTGLLNTVEAYSPATNTWTTLPALPTARADLAVAAAPCPSGVENGCVYAIGGLSRGALNTVEMYSPAADAWVTLPSMPTARFGLAASTGPCPKGPRSPCVYAFGGADDRGNPLARAEAFAIEHGR